MQLKRLLPGAWCVCGVLAVAGLSVAPQVLAHRDLEPRIERLERVLNNRALIEMQSKLAAMESELRELRGEIDVQKHRIARLERERDSAAAAPAPVAPGADDAAAEQAAYRAAFAPLQARDFETARESLAGFLAEYPSGKLAPNAVYWLGESHFALGEFANAVTRFEQLVAQHPQSGRLTNALLKLGFAYDELGNGDDARRVLRQLVAEHPDSDMAPLARKRLANLKSG